MDGAVWSTRELYGKNQFYTTSLENPESEVEVKLLQEGVKAKFIRIHPLEWEDSLQCEEDSSGVPRHSAGKYLNTLVLFDLFVTVVVSFPFFVLAFTDLV